MKSYEEVRSLLAGTPIPRGPDHRRVEWCDEDRCLGVSRSSGGGYELFIGTTRLHACIPLVRRHLRFDQWQTADGSFLNANRVVLPADDYYSSVTVMIAVELLRHEVSRDTAAAFTAVEPLIELALRRTAMEDDSLLGILGELLFLRQLLSNTGSPICRATALEAWRGYDRSARDFTFHRAIAIEVKTTTGSSSNHPVSGVSQVDPHRDANGEPVEDLYLASVGVVAAGGSSTGDTFTLASLVDEMLDLLDPAATGREHTAIQDLFLERLRGYGTCAGPGYDHDTMRTWGIYRHPHSLRFFRVYHMNSESIQVLRQASVRVCEHVDVASVRFTVLLPEVIEPGNPVADLEGFAASIAARMGVQ